MRTIAIDLKLHFLMLFLLALIYPAILLGIGLVLPEAANGFPVRRLGVTVGYKNLGQEFISDRYFSARPSAVGYNAASSGGSNKAVGNKEYLQEVNNRRNDFLKKNFLKQSTLVPSDMVTASGSGLDPHISLQSAELQINRVALQRNMDIEKLHQLVRDNVYRPFGGLIGTELVNVVQLNLALDAMSGH